MKAAALRIFLIALAATAVFGCTIHPIYNVKGAPVEQLGSKALTMADVEKAIARAGALQDWRMQIVKPGLIVGTVSWGRGHTAVVEITYSTKMYDITYKDSTNLDYTGTEIHRNYNRRIQDLDKGIRAQLLGL